MVEQVQNNLVSFLNNKRTIKLCSHPGSYTLASKQRCTLEQERHEIIYVLHNADDAGSDLMQCDITLSLITSPEENMWSNKS